MTYTFYFFDKRHNNNIQSFKSFKKPAATSKSIMNNSLGNLILKFTPQKFIKVLETKHVCDPRSVFSQKSIVIRSSLLGYNFKIRLKFVNVV